MAELDAILQPEEFRAADQIPRWAFFRNLRLLLGWGDGLWETLGDGMSAVRTVFVRGLPTHAPVPVGMNGFTAWREDFDADRPPMPFYARSVTDVNCMRIAANQLCEAYGGHPVCPETPCHHPVEANMDYRVAREAGTGGSASIVIEKRAKTLKPEHRAAMAKIGLIPVRGTGKRTSAKPADEKRERGERTPFEQGFADHMSRLKEAYRAERIPELLVDPAKRPSNFLVEMARQERLRLQLVAQKINDASKQPYRPYSQEELLLATVQGIADIEATALAHDYVWTPAARFDASGLTML